MKQSVTTVLESPGVMWNLVPGADAAMAICAAPRRQGTPEWGVSLVTDGPMLVVDVRGAATWTITESRVRWDFPMAVRLAIVRADVRAATPTRDLPPDVFEILVRGWMAVLRADYRQRHRDELGGVTLSPSAS